MTKKKVPIAVVLECPEDFVRKARWTLQNLFRMIGLPYRELQADETASDYPVILFYGERLPQALKVRDQSFLLHLIPADFNSSLARLSSQDVQKMEKNASAPENYPAVELFYLFSAPRKLSGSPLYENPLRGETVISRDSRKITLRADLVASAFYLLSLLNEQRANERDEFGRFHRRFSPIGETIYQQPVVDWYVRLLSQLLRDAARARGIELVLPPRWPEGKTFALVLSHDVDRLPSWTISKVKRAWRNAKKANLFDAFRAGGKLAASLLHPGNWSGNFRYITRLEAKYRARSTFFFAAPTDHRQPLDPRYSLRNTKIQRGFRQIARKGGFIGLHGSLSSATDARLLRVEKAFLESQTGQTIRGNRQHYLRFQGEETLDALTRASFAYDATLGFASESGYRCGTSLPFQPFSHRREAAFPIWEAPLILMETVLLLESKLALTADEAWPMIEQHLQTARQLGGCLTLNWHNNSVHPGDLTGYTRLYETILQWGEQHGAWITSLDELINWWGDKP